MTDLQHAQAIDTAAAALVAAVKTAREDAPATFETVLGQAFMSTFPHALGLAVKHGDVRPIAGFMENALPK